MVIDRCPHLHKEAWQERSIRNEPWRCHHLPGKAQPGAASLLGTPGAGEKDTGIIKGYSDKPLMTDGALWCETELKNPVCVIKS